MSKIQIAIFASGSGTNAEAIMKYFQGNAEVEVSLVLSNKQDAFVLIRAENFGVKQKVFNRDDFYTNQRVIELLKSDGIDYIILAGFLWLVPKELIAAFPNRIINIHPSLLPKYGGKGMYGSKVHQSVIQNEEKESGITIHLVNEIYDDGRILRQEKVSIEKSDTPDSLASKIHILEHQYFPITIDEYIRE